MKTRLLSLLLVMLASVMPMKLWAEESNAEPYAVLSGNNSKLTFYYDDQKEARGGMSVAGSFAYPGYQPWLSQTEFITSAEFDPSFANCTTLTSTAFWFFGCKNMVSISGIQYLKTDNVTKMSNMFGGCSGLTSLDVSGFKTDNLTDMRYMFSGCSGLTSLDVSRFNTDKVTNMDGMFRNCSNLTSLDLSGFKTDNVTDMMYMFSGCSGLTNLDIHGFNTANVTDMRYLFSGCSALTSLDVSGFNTANVTSMESMFSGCSGLTSLNVSGFKTDNVTNMSGMFDGCSGLASLDVSGFKTDNVTDMSNMFSVCSRLTSLDVSGFKTDNVTNMSGMFDVCSGLTSLDVSGFKTDNVTRMEIMFEACSGLTNLDVSNFNTANVTSMRYMFYVCSSLTSLDVSGFNTANVADMSCMFDGCSSLTSLDVSGFKTDNVTGMNYMFSGCSGLTSLDVSHFKTDNVTYMYGMFYGCSGLTSLDVSNFKTDNVTDMWGLFYGCSGLTSLDVSNFNTANVTSMWSMFRGCSGLTSLDVGGFKTDNVTNMESMFSGCSGLKTIYSGSGWTTNAVTDGNDMFSLCTSLVGGAGTPYDASHVDYTYAHIDGGENNPGYFTDKNAAPVATVEPYAVLSENNTVLTFYYDTEKEARGGMGVGPFSHYSQRPWQTSADDITTIVIDDSFAQCDTLTNIAWWFYELKNLTQINGMANLKTDHVTDMSHLFAVSWSLSSVDVSHFNTSNVTNMEGMFASCWALTSLDVSNFNTEKVTNMAGMFNSLNGIITLDISNFNTANVTNMQGMFASNQSLTTIFVGSGWSTASVTDNGGSGVFSGSTSIIGGQGTVFDADHTDYTYAHIDGGASNPGYFTDKNATPSQNFAEYIWEVGVNNNWDGDREPLYCGDGRGTYVGFFYAQDADWSEGKGAFKFRGSPDNWDNGNYGTGTINQDGLSGTLINDNASGNILAEPAFYRAEVNLANMTYQLTSISAIGIIGTAQSGGWNIDTDMTYNKETRAWEATVDLAADEFKFRANHAWDINWGGTADSLVANGENLRIDEAGTYFIQFFPLCETKSYCIITKKSSAGTTPEPYAVLSDNNTVLRFYYDDQKESRGGMSVGPFRGPDLQSWYGAREIITTAVFDDSFANCTTLTSTAYWFDDCSKLTAISGISNLKTDNVTDMSSMFADCSGLTSLEVSGFNTANVTDMHEMFNGCSGLTSLDVSGFKTDKVTSMRHMFVGCSALTSLDVRGFRTDNVTNMGSMFYGCSSLTSLDVSGFNTTNVTDMSDMFNSCSSLTSLDVSNFNTGNVTNMSAMFSSCSGLTSLDLSNFNTSNVFDMSHLFSDCSHLTSIYAGEGWSTAIVAYGNSMFYDCTSLVGGAGTVYDANHTDHTYAHIDGGTSNPGYFTANNERVINGKFVTTDYSSFAIGYNYQIQELSPNNIVEDSDDPNNLCVKVVSLDDSNPNQMGESEFLIRIGEPLQLGQKYTFSMRAKANRNAAIQSLALKDNYEYLHWKMVGDYNLTTEWKTYTYEAEVVAEQVGCLTIAFCLDLESQSTEYFFDDISFRVNEVPSASPEPYAVLSDNNTKLTFFYDTDKDVRGGMSVGPFYMNDSGTIEGRQWNDAAGSITTVVFDNSFVNCTSLTSTYGWFYGCKNLITITDIGNLKTDNVADMSYMFSDCSSLKALNVSGFKTDKVVNIWFMFSGCSSLTSLDVSGFNMGNVWGMNGMFSGCSGLTTIDLGNFNTENVRYMTGMFGECSGLTSLDVSGFNTTNVIDMNSMFRGCSSLTSLDLGKFNTLNVTDLSFMFWRCNNLLDLDISSFNTANAKMVRIFEECSSLASIRAGNANIPAEEYTQVNNPNLLVYVNDASLAPQGVQNVVVNGLAREIVLTDVTDGNNDWYAPQAFVAERISYTRNFGQSTTKGTSRGWESIALPFHVQTIQHETKGVIAPFNNPASSRHFWLRRLTENGLQPVTGIEANIPYIISMPNSEEYTDDYNLNGRVTFSAQNAQVPATVTNTLALADSSIVMVPAMQRKERSSAVWALNVGEVRGSYFEGSVFERDYREVRPFEAYTVHRLENSQPAPRYIPIQEIGGTTGIETIDHGPLTIDRWYDLEGRKLQGQPKQKGVYISKGKKVVIK